MNMFRKLLVTALASAGLAVSSYASPLIYIWDGTGNSMTINDNQSGDTSALSGVVNWSGTMGAWDVFVGTTGITSGTLSQPNLDLNVVASSTSGGFLGVYYGDTGFGPTSGTVTATIGGTLGGNGSLVNSTAYTDGNDVGYPGNFTSILTTATYTGNPFSGSASAGLDDAGPYGLYEAIYLTTTAAGTSSFDANLSVPDSSSTALLIGLGLLGIGVAARRNKAA